MLTEDQLADQLRVQLRRETAAIEPRPDLLARLRRRQAQRSFATRAGIALIPATAAVIAIATITSGGTGTGRGGGTGHTVPRQAAVLTAATVHAMVTDSRLALARSGRAAISYRQSDNGAWQSSGTDTISFADGRVRWYHDTNPSNHPSVQIPDPRTLFGLLDPSARFKIIGHEVIDGVRLTELRAAKAPRLRALGWLPGVAPGARVELLTVWVDRHNIVHRMSLRVRQVTITDPIYLEKHANGTLEFVVPSKAYLKAARAMARKLRPPATVGIDPKLSATVRHDVQLAAVSVIFSAFGRQPVITAPKNAIPQYTRS